MFIPQRLRRNILPWLCAVAFVANFLCADGVLDVAQPLLGSASQESARQLADGASQDVHEHLTFGIASAQAASTGAKERGQVIDFFRMAMGGVAGLVLFIYGVTRLAESLEELSTERMRKFLSTATTNRFAGVFTGIVATTLLESSSVTIIMVIAMVSSGVLTFVQSLGVVLGSNIGTAVGAQIISVGCIFTVIIQSSSATLAIVITLASSRLISLPAGIAIMLGAEVGTCSDTLLATLGRGRSHPHGGVSFAPPFPINLCYCMALDVILAPSIISRWQSWGRKV